jgi:hypothetical protein
MQTDSFRYVADREAYVLDAADADRRFRLLVPLDFVREETGAEASEQDRLDWLQSHLPGILEAWTAREGGGIVREPWGRVIVEETD